VAAHQAGSAETKRTRQRHSGADISERSMPPKIHSLRQDPDRQWRAAGGSCPTPRGPRSRGIVLARLRRRVAVGPQSTGNQFSAPRLHGGKSEDSCLARRCSDRQRRFGPANIAGRLSTMAFARQRQDLCGERRVPQGKRSGVRGAAPLSSRAKKELVEGVRCPGLQLRGPARRSPAEPLTNTDGRRAAA
jgi:hypothetical protein